MGDVRAGDARGGEGHAGPQAAHRLHLEHGAQAGPQVRRSLHGQGTGRHSSEEVDLIGKKIVTAIADYMGDGPYFLGEKASSIDATVYAFLASIMDAPFPSNVKTFAASLPALRAYCDRMKAAYWSS
jgi:glutathione S-transferase